MLGGRGVASFPDFTPYAPSHPHTLTHTLCSLTPTHSHTHLMLPHTHTYMYTSHPQPSHLHIPSHLTLSHTLHSLTLTHPHILTDKLLLFFTHGATAPVDRLNDTFFELTPVIISTIMQRNMETGNTVTISVYREQEVIGDPFRSGFFNLLPMVHNHVSCAKD